MTQLPEAYLVRRERATGYTLGHLFARGFSCWTMEPPWRDNALGLSCIPPGPYVCVWRLSPARGWCYWLQGTAPRTWVLIHSGNLARHTMGCILPGMRAGWLGGSRAVLNSRRAIALLGRHFEEEAFRLWIY